MNAPPLLSVDDLVVTYPGRRSLFNLRPGVVHAVNGVSFEIASGETLGVVGESGSGKSTTGNTILGTVLTDAGSVRFDGTELTTFRGKYPTPIRRDIQAVFQDPTSSLNPSKVIADIIGEPLDIHEHLGKAERLKAAEELLSLVGLSRAHLERKPHEFSGGQRQRIAIARALALGPRLLVLDEPVSALDVSTQAQVMNLLQDLQQRLGLTYLLIAHDLAVVHHASDRIAVMYLGTIVEEGPAAELYASPAHPYTQALLEAVPVANPIRQRARRKTGRTGSGEIPSPLAIPTGCLYQTRCPQVRDECRVGPPPVVELDAGRRVACVLYADESTLPATESRASRAEIPATERNDR